MKIIRFVMLSATLGACVQDKSMDTANDLDSGEPSDSTDTGDSAEETDSADTQEIDPFEPSPYDPDINQDGALSILILGSRLSVGGGQPFSTDAMTQELQSIFESDSLIDLDIIVKEEDIFRSAPVTIGLGGNGAEYTYTHYAHSLLQYYYWPENQQSRMSNLMGDEDNDWDYVVITSDPYILANMPGYYALGMHKITSKVTQGGGIPLLFMMWPQDSSLLPHFEEFTRRTSQGASVPASVVPGGSSWAALSDQQRDESILYPTPNGAYVAAASIYSHISNNSASVVDYSYDDELADIAYDIAQQEANIEEYSSPNTFVSPFQGCFVQDAVLTYNHTGSSSENGILDGLNWAFEQSSQILENGGGASTFNYGRANSNFEENKRYKINQELFQYSFGFPMQDHGNHGDESMLYGLDKRDGGVMNDTDLGVARFMIDESELPYARAVPIRTLFAQMKEDNPQQSGYRDSWHMHRDLDKAIGAYMHTVLTNTCSLGQEPADSSSDVWNTWNAHKIGCETAWTLMNMEETFPF